MTGNLQRPAAAAAACALIAAGAACGSSPARSATASPARSATAGQRCPPPAGGGLAGRVVTVTGKPYAGSATELASPGPDGGLACRYYPSVPDSTGLQLQRSARLTAQAARQIAAQLSGLPASHGGALTSCPYYQSRHDTLVFTYPHGPAAYVNVGRSDVGAGPCNPVTNGVVSRPSTQALISTLNALLDIPAKVRAG